MRCSNVVSVVVMSGGNIVLVVVRCSNVVCTVVMSGSDIVPSSGEV